MLPDKSSIEICGDLTRMVPFSDVHLNDSRYLSWLHDYEVVKTLYLRDYLEPVPFPKVASYVEQMMASETDLFLALYHHDDDAFIGTLKAGHIDWNASIADVGIMIGDRNYWGKGLATDAVGALANWLFDDLGLRRLTAGAMGINSAMLRVFENLGFRREGVFRKHDRFEDGYCDHIYFGCFACELRSKVPTGS